MNEFNALYDIIAYLWKQTSSRGKLNSKDGMDDASIFTYAVCAIFLTFSIRGRPLIRTRAYATSSPSFDNLLPGETPMELPAIVGRTTTGDPIATSAIQNKA